MSVVARVAAALALLPLIIACGANRPTTAPPRDAGLPHREVLGNGVRVIVQEQRTADVVAVQLWVAAGGRDETPEELGAAHYLEHMLLKATSTRPSGSVEREAAHADGRVDAATCLDYTVYRVTLPAARMASAVDLIADLAVNASLDDAMFAAEKRVIVEEMRGHDDDPRRFLPRHLRALAFAGHPYGRPLVGRQDLVQAFTRDTLLAFYRRHYVTPAFVVVVVGNVDAAASFARVRASFARIPRGQVARLPAPQPPPPAARRETLRRTGAKAYLGLSWRAPRLDHADAPAMELLAGVLARLPTSLRERPGVVNAVTAEYTAMQAAGIASIIAELDAVSVAQAEREIVAELGRLRTRGITEAERRHAVTAAQARHESSMATAEGRAFALGRAETMSRMEDALAWTDRLRSVTLAQLRLVARRYLDPDRYVRLAVLPDGVR